MKIYSEYDDEPNMKLAPIALFVYNRPAHTRQTVEALLKNVFAGESDLIIFSDAPKKPEAALAVLEVREYIKTISGFKSVTIIERDENLGLAKSIISGVTEVVNVYGKIIVLEDDIVTSPAFLTFMNKALDYYQNQEKVWHISGWNYPINSEGLGDVFFWRAMNCWGWATWADRWANFEKNSHRLIEQWTDEKKYHFDLDGSGVFWPQVTSNAEEKINTWAIFWYATIYQKNGLCLNPSLTFVDNIGHDGSGVHCGNAGERVPITVNPTAQINFPNDICESNPAVTRIQDYFRTLKRSFIVRVINKISRILIKKNFIK